MPQTRPAATAPLRAVVLDFDGLIVDTETPIWESWREAYREHGRELLLDDWQHALGTHGGFDPCAHLGRLLGRQLDADALRARVRARNLERCARLPLMPGVADLLDQARELGLALGVASSSSCQWVTGWLERHGVRDRFGAVCARDDVAAVKPAPDVYLLVADRLGVEPAACLVFEDSPNGARAALSAGMRCVAVPNAITCELAFPEVDVVLDGLEGVALDGLIALVSATPRGVRGDVEPRQPGVRRA